MKVLIVDDHPLVRKGLLSALSLENTVQEVHEASCVAEAINLISMYNPEICIVDLRLGREDGLEIVNKAKQNHCKARFIVLTSSSKKDDFIRARQSGVDGYILKEAFTEDILYAFHVVARGRIFYDPEVLQFKSGQSVNATDNLTEREKDVLSELGKGLSNMQIAQKLFISEHTVKKHISSILSKLGLSHRTEAALYANNIYDMANIV